MPGPEPFVFGISGPWGSGKTSLLNMIGHELRARSRSNRKVVIFRFNPWWFSGSDTLMVSFLHDFAKVLGAEVEGAVSKRLAEYLTIFGHLLKPARFIPGLGAPAEALSELAVSGGEAMGKAGELASRDAAGIRREIDRLLLEKRQPVLVIVDDVDRLLPDEIIQVFRIVKAVADFPFVRYWREASERGPGDAPKRGPPMP
jgi:predicted KAP-like P-loop ATPase